MQQKQKEMEMINKKKEKMLQTALKQRLDIFMVLYFDAVYPMGYKYMHDM